MTPNANPNSSDHFDRLPISRQLGVTLVELLVSMFIASLVLAGVLQMMVDNKSKFRLADELSFIQENVRFAMDELGNDLRMVGYSGCGAATNVANVVDSTDVFFSGFGLEGWDGSEAISQFPTEFRSDMWDAGSWSSGDEKQPDSFVARFAQTDESMVIDESSTNTNSSAVIKILGTHSVSKGEIMIATSNDCSQVSIFQNTQQNNNGNAAQFGHNKGNSVSPGNCVKDLFGVGSCSATTGLTSKNFGNGGVIYRMTANAYYLGPSSIDASIPALYREKLQAQSNSAATISEELLIGVENMQISYGLDTDTTFDAQANQYVTADEINGTGVMTWDRVVSARVELLMRSIDPVWPEDTAFTFKGTTYSDRFLRQRLASTVLLRNQALVK